jgi:serine/threonine protein kinase
VEDSSSERSPLGVLAEEFVERYRNGERPSLTEYAERAPELASEIRSLFPTLVEMEQLKPVTGDHTGHYAEPIPPDLERLGEFRILRRVGIGGMGVVYEAVQESLGRHVAMKVLPVDALADPKRLERFRREAKAAAKLHHTNIVPVFGTGEAEGRHYYAMQFIVGHPLDAVIDEVRRLKDNGLPAPQGAVSQVALGLVSGTIAANADSESAKPAAPPSSSLAASGSLSDGGRHYWATVARIGEQVAGALAYAHGQGILHRDIKPANLLLDLHGIVWVTDFGLAKAHESDSLTIAGDIVGTLRYMAPERFDGGGDHRADVYALGLTLYELLTLKPAFAADNRAKLVEQVVAASPLTPRSINPAIPRDLETIVLKAIARDPTMRYQSAMEMADDLRRYQDDRPITARRASQFEQAWRWCRRNPAVAALVASLFLVFGLGAGVSALFAVRAERKEVEARRNADEAQQNAIEAQVNLEQAQRSSQQAARSAAEASDNARTATENARQAAAREKEAVDARERLQREQEQGRRLVYASKIREAGEALNEERIPRVRQLLEETKPKLGEPDLRGWEWHYLAREIRPAPARELRLGREPRNKVPQYDPETVLSADGRFLIHNHWTGSGVWFEVWDLATSQRVGRAPADGAAGWNGPMSSVAHAIGSPTLSPDGKHIGTVWPAGSSNVKTKTEWRVRIWEVATGAELDCPMDPTPRCPGHLQIGAGGVSAVWTEFEMDGITRADSRRTNEPYQIARWTRESGKIERKRIDPAPGVVNVVVAPDGRHAVAFPRDVSKSPAKARQNEFWDLTGDTPKVVNQGTPGSTATTRAHAFSALFGDAPAVVATIDGQELSVYQLSDGQRLWHTPLAGDGNSSAPSIMGISDDGRRVVFNETYFLRIVEKTGDDATSPVRQWTVRLEGREPGSVRKLTPDARELVTVVPSPPSDKERILIRVTDLSRDTHGLKPHPLRNPAEEDPRRTISGAPLKVSDPDTGQPLGRVEVHKNANDRIEAVRVLPSKDRVMVAMRVFTGPAKGRTNERANGFGGPGFGREAFPNPNRVDPEPVTLRLYDLTTGKELWNVRTGQFHTEWNLVCDRDGGRAYCSSRNSFGRADVHVVRLADGVVERTFRVSEGGNSQVSGGWNLARIDSIAPDGRLVVVEGNEVQLWDGATGRLSHCYEGGAVKTNFFGTQVRFSKDGRRMVTTDGRLHVWDLTTDRELLTLTAEGAIPLPSRSYGHFSFDGDKIVVGYKDGLREFDGTPEKP